MTPGGRRTRSRILAAAGVAALGAALAAPALAQPDGAPNILLVITDDIGMDVTTGMYPGMIEDLTARYGPEGFNHPDYTKIAGHPASTPVLDRFAGEGMVFANAWAEPFCSPTRAALLTGLFTAKTNVLTYADPLSSRHTSFVELLRDHGGYSAGVFGKWHMAGLPGQANESGQPVDFPGMKPLQAGFQIFRGNMHAAPPTYWDYEYQIQDGTTAWDEWRTEAPPLRSLPGLDMAPTTYLPVVQAADAIEWIGAQEAADPDRPWFAWLAFNLAHATARTDPSQMIVPPVETLDAASRAEMEACTDTFGTADLGACAGEAVNRAMTNSLDTVLGHVLAAVDALDPNTYVIVIGDNGTPMYGRPGLDFIDNMYITREGRGKGSAYESGLRVSLAVRGPGVEAGGRSGEFVHAADLFSTILDIAGLVPPALVPDSAGDGLVRLDSVSLAPILFGEADSVRDPDTDTLVTETLNLMTGGTQHAGARNASHKLVCAGGVGAEACEFYDIAADPLEEYPLTEVADCSGYASAWTPADDGWHYCRLMESLSASLSGRAPWP